MYKKVCALRQLETHPQLVRKRADSNGQEDARPEPMLVTAHTKICPSEEGRWVWQDRDKYPPLAGDAGYMHKDEVVCRLTFRCNGSGEHGITMIGPQANTLCDRKVMAVLTRALYDGIHNMEQGSWIVLYNQPFHNQFPDAACRQDPPDLTSPTHAPGMCLHPAVSQSVVRRQMQARGRTP